jgi:hypothetical protein
MMIEDFRLRITDCRLNRLECHGFQFPSADPSGLASTTV